MLPTQTQRDAVSGPSRLEGGTDGESDPNQTTKNELSPTENSPPVGELFPPGPLESVRIVPNRLRVERQGTKRARAEALTGDGRLIRPVGVDIEFKWELWGRIGALSEIRGKKDQILFTATDEVTEGIISVLATLEGHQASAVAPVEVVESLPAGPSDEGIPEPELVDQPGAPWRSRISDGHWQVNTGHPDYKTNSKRPALKLRYLALLFAKEVVLRSSQDPRLDGPLESVVEIAAFADRKLTDRSPRRGPRSQRKDEGKT
jgi:hypothetical protein